MRSNDTLIEEISDSIEKIETYIKNLEKKNEKSRIELGLLESRVKHIEEKTKESLDLLTGLKKKISINYRSDGSN